MFKSVEVVGKVVGSEGAGGTQAVAEDERRDFSFRESGKVVGQEFRLLLFALVAWEVPGQFGLGKEVSGGAG